HAGAAIQHLAHGAGIHQQVLRSEVAARADPVPSEGPEAGSLNFKTSSKLGLLPSADYGGPVMADIKSLTRPELAEQFAAWNQPAYRVDQLLHWLYVRRATSWDAMSNLPKSLRQQLQEHYTLQPLELVRTQGAGDSTQKFLWKLGDGAFIESVLL